MPVLVAASISIRSGKRPPSISTQALRIGGREDELHVLGRLLERLQHRVECMPRKHVHLVDDVDLEASHHRHVLRAVEEIAHLVDLGVGRRVHLEQVDEAAGIDFHARRAFVAGLRRHAGLAVQALGEDARKRGLADAARARKQIGVVQALMLEPMAQRAHDVLLSHKTGEIARPPLAGQDLVAHRSL